MRVIVAPPSRTVVVSVMGGFPLDFFDGLDGLSSLGLFPPWLGPATGVRG